MNDNLIELFDRFSFDNFFRMLLEEEYETEDALEYILYNCALSALVFQERIDNEYYKQISLDEDMSSDLKELRQEIFNKYYPNRN